MPTVKSVDSQSKSSGVRVAQLQKVVRKGFISGSINRWRVQADSILISPEGWKSPIMSFTNDPITPAQSRIESMNVIATEEKNGDFLIKTSRSRLILDETFSLPMFRNQRIKKTDEVENQWVLGVDTKDRDGFFIGRQFKSLEFGDDYKISLQPQFMLQRAINGKTNSYVVPGKAMNSNKVSSNANIGDILGLKAGLTGQTFGWDLNATADISSFNSERISDATRYGIDFRKTLRLPFLNDLDARIFRAYRYRAWNGSLGETDIFSAYGAFIDKKYKWAYGRVTNDYLFRVGVGKYKAEKFGGGEIFGLWRSNIYSSLHSKFRIWEGKKADLDLAANYKYSPTKISPGLIFNTKLSTAYSIYEDGRSLNTISLSGGPTLTLGTFTRPFLDYTKLSISAGGTLKQGGSPFDFDEAIDLGTVGVGISQQIAGPLVLNTGMELNIDSGSKYFGKAINSKIELQWQRRSYDFALFYRPYQGIGGLVVRLNEFDFDGTGVPFVPYSPY